MWSNKNAYILQKIYIDDFKLGKIENEDINIELFCAIKAVLKIAKRKKSDDLYYFFSKYSNLILGIEILITKYSLKYLDIFLQQIKRGNYKRSCDFGSSSLDEVKSLNSHYIKLNKSKNASYFFHDYQKIVYSSAFRRLQDKTQLFVMDNNDFTRTRLTHSLEVSSIAEKLAYNANIEKHIIKYDYKNNPDLYYDRADCTMLARISGILHDIGNPPFGHSGERDISNYFKNIKTKNMIKEYGLDPNSDYYLDLQCFDGNAQSLRIATKLMSFDNKEGASLTAGALGTIIKYPYNSKNNTTKRGYYLTEEEIIKDMSHLGVYKENIKNPFTYILEAADDLAYLISDLEDAIHKKVIRYNDFAILNNKDPYCSEFYHALKQRYDMERSTDDEKFEKIIKPMLFQFRENLIFSIAGKDIFKKIINEVQDNTDIFQSSDYYQLYSKLKEVKKTAMTCEEIKTNEKKGTEIINIIMSNILPALLKADKEMLIKYEIDDDKMIIPFNLIKCYEKELNKKQYSKDYDIYCRCRILIDYVSGMTDSYAEQISKK